MKKYLMGVRDPSQQLRLCRGEMYSEPSILTSDVLHARLSRPFPRVLGTLTRPLDRPPDTFFWLVDQRTCRPCAQKPSRTTRQPGNQSINPIFDAGQDAFSPCFRRTASPSFFSSLPGWQSQGLNIELYVYVSVCYCGRRRRRRQRLTPEYQKCIPP